jgi:hypothetical protein
MGTPNSLRILYSTFLLTESQAFLKSYQTVGLQNVTDINDRHANSCVDLTEIEAIVFSSIPPGKCTGCTTTNFSFIIILWALHNQRN